MTDRTMLSSVARAWSLRSVGPVVDGIGEPIALVLQRLGEARGLEAFR